MVATLCMIGILISAGLGALGIKDTNEDNRLWVVLVGYILMFISSIFLGMEIG